MERSVIFQHQPGDIDRGQRGVQVAVELVLAAGLALGQARELLGVAEQKLNLEAQVVVIGDLCGLLLQVGRGQQHVLVAAGVQQQHHAQCAGEALGMEQLRVEADVVVDGMSPSRLPAAQLVEAGLALVLPIRPALAGLAAVEPQVVQVGVAAQASNRRPSASELSAGAGSRRVARYRS